MLLLLLLLLYFVFVGYWSDCLIDFILCCVGMDVLRNRCWIFGDFLLFSNLEIPTILNLLYSRRRVFKFCHYLPTIPSTPLSVIILWPTNFTKKYPAPAPTNSPITTPQYPTISNHLFDNVLHNTLLLHKCSCLRSCQLLSIKIAIQLL